MKKILVLAVILFSFAGCQIFEDEDLLGVNIRLSNVSAYDFKNIVVDTSEGPVSYEDLDAGQTSDYQVFQLAYRYAFVELTIDGETYTLQPIDYVGETPLENRLYTYEINANDSQEQYSRLSLTLIED